MDLNGLRIAAVVLGLLSAGFAISAEKINVPYKDILQAPFQQADKTLSYGASPLQFGKLWLPKPKEQKPPLLIFLHGGCWLNAFNIEHSFALTSALANSGAMVWSIEYRRTGDEGGGWPGTFEDTVKGVKFALDQSQWGFDPTKVFIVGHSAGGHLALLANDALAKSRYQNIEAIGLAAITDVISYSQGTNSCQSATDKFMGGSYVQQKHAYVAATPKRYDNVTLIHGSRDNIVPIEQSEKASASVLVVEGAGHFDFLHPQSTAYAALLSVIYKRNE
ncbi:MAG: alpha/beta hydrolase [Aliiglaciecola sp.]